MATVTLSLHAKQPKRGDDRLWQVGYIELYEYPRIKSGHHLRKMDHKKWSKQEKTAKALQYESPDMEAAVAGKGKSSLL